MKNNLLILTALLICSCNSQQVTENTKEKTAFHLNSANFQENIKALYTDENLNRQDVDYALDSVSFAQLPDSVFSYKISNLMTDNLGFKLPKEDFGYLYKSREIDSLVKFDSLYFKSLYTLTDKNQKPVAYYASSRYEKAAARNAALQVFMRKFGKPAYQFFIGEGFNKCSYEWALGDRTVQVETSFGVEAVFSSDNSGKTGKYYLLDLLVIDNRHKDSIYMAHTLEVPDKIAYGGKLHSYKDFQLEKTLKVRDEFLLNSTFDAYTKNEFGMYDISRAETEE